MAVDLKECLAASLKVARLTANALENTEVARMLIEQPLQVAAKAGISVQGAQISSRLVQKGQQSVGTSVRL